jgi:hypothetical protein
MKLGGTRRRKEKMMRQIASVVVAFALLVGIAPGVLARCGDHPTDEQQVKDARAEVASTCNCGESVNHGAYVKCASLVANSRVSNLELSPSCKKAVVICAAHSACGKIAKGAVTCCVTKKGKTACKVFPSAAKCAAKHGTVGGIDGLHTSCCSDTAPLTTNSCLASPAGAFLD